jgi:uncharacterized protein (DUF4415 family)
MKRKPTVKPPRRVRAAREARRAYGARRDRDRTDWTRVDALSDAEIARAVAADPDASLADAAFWKRARLVYPERKQVVTLRLDRDLIAWLRAGGRGYQTRINALLRAVKDGRLAPR